MKKQCPVCGYCTDDEGTCPSCGYDAKEEKESDRIL